MKLPLFKALSPEEYQVVFEDFDIPKSFEDMLKKELAQLPLCKYTYFLHWLKNKLLFPRHHAGNSRDILKFLVEEIREGMRITQEDSEMLFQCCLQRTRNTFSVLVGMKKTYGETGWLFSEHLILRTGNDLFSIWLPSQD